MKGVKNLVFFNKLIRKERLTIINDLIFWNGKTIDW